MFKFFLGLCVSALLVTESLQAEPAPAINVKATKRAVYNSVVKGDYEAAVNLSITLSGLPDYDIGDIVTRLITNKKTNVMSYAYKLWQKNKNIVIDNFPEEFKLIFDDDNTTSAVIIVNKRFGQALKLDSNKDSDGDRLAWGDKDDKTGERVSWRIIPVWNDNNVTFKLQNIHYDMYLKLASQIDFFSSRRAYGSTNSGEVRHRYYFVPQFIENELIFDIKNCQYDVILRLALDEDAYGDRAVYAGGGSFVEVENRDKWMVLPW